MGGKRALAAASGVSESQLYRYMADESAIPAARLLAIAQAAGVNPGWLLTGTGRPDIATVRRLRPEFRPDLLKQVIQVFEELMLEYNHPFPPQQRARAISFIYEAIRLEEVLQGAEVVVTKGLGLLAADFLSGIRSEESIQALHEMMELLEFSHLEPQAMSSQGLNRFVNLICRANMSMYNNETGATYFDRMGTVLTAKAAARLTQFIEVGGARQGGRELSLLDIGSGNGRHLSYLYRHFENLKVYGIDSSLLGVTISRQLEQAQKLPAQCVVQGDFRQLPFPDASMDLAYARMSLYCLPYLPGTGLGAEELMKEIYRVLKPGGWLKIVSLLGIGREYLPFIQYYDENLLRRLCESVGLEVVHWDSGPLANDNSGIAGRDYENKYDRVFRVLIRKN